MCSRPILRTPATLYPMMTFWRTFHDGCLYAGFQLWKLCSRKLWAYFRSSVAWCWQSHLIKFAFASFLVFMEVMLSFPFASFPYCFYRPSGEVEHIRVLYFRVAYVVSESVSVTYHQYGPGQVTFHLYGNRRVILTLATLQNCYEESVLSTLRCFV